MPVKAIGPAEVYIKSDENGDRIKFRVLLETDEHVEFALNEQTCDELVTKWLARRTPALALPLESRAIAEALFTSDKPSARFVRRGIL